MTVTCRSYSSEPFFSQDNLLVRDFLLRINQTELYEPNFTWTRWEWMTTHSSLDRSMLSRIGLWEDEGQLVALATYESRLGEAFLVTDPSYRYLIPTMIDYAKEYLSNEQGLTLVVADNDRIFQRTASAKGFIPTTKGDHTSAIDLDSSLDYNLPEGFRIISKEESWDWYQYNRVMWRGFNHEGPVPEDENSIAIRKQMLSSSMIRPELVLAVISPQGEYVAHCGAWYRVGDSCAEIEPLATDPDFRKRGLGKAVVFEALKRCAKLGAKQAMVGSSQQFYYSIGFHPIHHESLWILRTNPINK
jgi:GNAT superfamily N-acetyltransferase